MKKNDGSAPLPSRVLLLELDSVRQAKRLGPLMAPGEAKELKDALAGMVGMIRTALMVADELIVTDSMILDGLVFLHMPPTQLAESLGCPVHQLPITVVAEQPTLQASLASKQAKSGFQWQLREALTRAKNADRADELIRQHWDAWTDPHLPLHVKEYGTSGATPPPGQFITQQPDPQWHRELSETAQWFLERLMKQKRRSDAEHEFRIACERYPAQVTDLRQVREWWESAYLIRIAEKNEADWMRFSLGSVAPAGSTPPSQSPDGQTHHRHRVRIQGALEVFLRQLPPTAYAVIRHQVTAERTRLRRRPSDHRMKDLSYAVEHVFESRHRSSVIWSSVGRLGLAVLAAIAAFPNISGELFGFDLVWVAFGAAAISTVPYGDFPTLF